jgi:hypothetical protein
MKATISFLAALLLAGSLGAAPATAEEVSAGDAGVIGDGILLREELVPGSNYGHLRFPAIREETLGWDRPVLKDADSGDVIDFYGPLDHDPLGEEEIRRQREQVRRETRNVD